MKLSKIALNVWFIAIAVYTVHLGAGLSRSYSNYLALNDAITHSEASQDPYAAALALDQAYESTYEGTDGPYEHCRLCYTDERYRAEDAQSQIDELMIKAIANGDVRAIEAVYQADANARVVDRALRDRAQTSLQKAAKLSDTPKSVRALAQEIRQKGKTDGIFYSPEGKG